MSIEIGELNTWIGTDEGKAWADGLKAPLLAKRDELLSGLRTANGSAAQAAQRAADADKALADEREAMRKVLIDDTLAAALKKTAVFDAAIPGCVSAIKEGFALDVEANGLSRIVSGKIKGADGQETRATLDAIVQAWHESPEGKENTREGNTGGGAPGSGAGHSSPASSLSGLSGPALARMSDKDFQAAIADARKGQ